MFDVSKEARGKWRHSQQGFASGCLASQGCKMLQKHYTLHAPWACRTYICTHVHTDVSVVHCDAMLHVAALFKDLLVDVGCFCMAAVAYTPAIRQRDCTLL